MNITKFEIGKTYATPSVCDSNCIFRIKVLKRSAKFVTVDAGAFGVRRCGVNVYEGVEQVRAIGSYSFAPIFSADEIAA